MYASKRCFGEYNSLDDYYLQGYFTNKQLRKQLRKAGLMNRDGAPVPEAIYRTNVIKAERRRRAKEELTKCLVAESINLQRQYENEIKSRLDEIAKLERVRKLRLETRPISQRAQTRVKKKDLKYYLTALDKRELRRPHTVFECQLAKHAEKIQFEGDETIDPSEHIKTLITMQFLGDGKDMTQAGSEGQREIYVEQMIYRQKPLWVYLGQHKPLDFFKFTTYRHPTFPFCLNMYINGMLHLRIHTCCEYKFPIGTRLGGPSGKFVLLDVQGTITCGRCQCQTNKGLIPKLSETLMNQLGNREQIVCHKDPVCPCHNKCIIQEETSTSFGSPCHECMHLEGKCPTECKCACVHQSTQDQQHIHVYETSNRQCIQLEEEESQSEQDNIPAHECIQLQRQEQGECHCRCHCQIQSPDENICTEESSSPQGECTCMKNVANKGHEKTCTCQVDSDEKPVSTFQIAVNDEETSTEEEATSPQKPCKHKCKCVSQKQDDFFNVEVYDLGSSSSVEESEGTESNSVCRERQSDPSQDGETCVEIIDGEESSENQVPCCKIVTREKPKASADNFTECSCSDGTDFKEDFTVEIKTSGGSSRSERGSSDNCISSDKASQGSSVRKGYSTCCETNMDTDMEEGKNSVIDEGTICSTCCQLKKSNMEGQNKIVHIVEKPIKMNITIEGIHKKDRSCKQQAIIPTCGMDNQSDVMRIRVSCDDANAELSVEPEDKNDVITQTSYSDDASKSDTWAESKERRNEAESTEAAEPAEAAELPLSVEHSRKDKPPKVTEITVQIMPTDAIEWLPPYHSPEEFEPSIVSPPPVKSPPRVESPPVKSPPRVESPPVKSPPRVESPPVKSPPRVESPPVKSPPRVESPPVKSPPRVESPPVKSPPRVESPPVKSPPPAVSPPVKSPPPAVSPPVKSPPPVESPPVEASSVKSPPPVESPVKSPPPVESPVKSPPPAESPVKSPPPVEPPVEPPVKPASPVESPKVVISPPTTIVVTSPPESPPPAEPEPPVEPPPPAEPAPPVEPPPPAEPAPLVEPPPPAEPAPPVEPPAEPVPSVESPPPAEPASLVESSPPVEPATTAPTELLASDQSSPEIQEPIDKTSQLAEEIPPPVQTETSAGPIVEKSELTPPADDIAQLSDTTISSEETLDLPPEVLKKDIGTDPVAKVNACTQLHADTFKFDKSTETTFNNLLEEDSLSIITSYENSVLWRRTSIFP